MERKLKIGNGHIVVKNPLYQEIPKHEVTIRSDRTVYCFAGNYDEERALSEKTLYPMKRSCKMKTCSSVVLEQGVLAHMRLVINCVANHEKSFRQVMGAKQKPKQNGSLLRKKGN